MVSSAEEPPVLQPRVMQLCRVLLRLRLILSVLAVLLLGSSVLSWKFATALVFAVLSSLLAYLFWRRLLGFLQRHPILLGLDTFISLLVLTLAGRAAPFLVFTVVTSLIAGLLYRWGGMLCIVGLQVICYTTAVLLEAGTVHVTIRQALLVPVIYYPLVGFAGLWIRGMLDDAERADAARRAAEVTSAAERERTRLARDMHDSLAKTVRGIAFAAAALPAWIRRDPERAAREAGNIAAAAEVASREARDLLTDLRSDRLDQPLSPTLRTVCADWSQRTGVDTSVELDDSVDLGVSPRYELVNVLKEALSNVERHAQASSVTVRLTADGGDVLLTVADDGAGFDVDARNTFVSNGHYGLLGMTERARRVGGEIELGSTPGAGSTVTLRLPADSGRAEQPSGEPAAEVPAPTGRRPERALEAR